ncbi:hypothetical protein H696_03486 [Fonticula alba]|uniref:Anaphase-promoting complex subunit 4 WD40 domain-containing protein n=1 Tax=Fonticula alba TaxID=691883 RepID=A0A058Z6X0_FONAL|nr:hypothetical protein H696_03486 [Fonticula alba]KCV70019.1 hypothetical protein H696_03486 [Fonticula alba]|eukprot:XP_009495625.1 hypothetical protein H696_03486 [Fonticula alba]
MQSQRQGPPPQLKGPPSHVHMQQAQQQHYLISAPDVNMHTQATGRGQFERRGSNAPPFGRPGNIDVPIMADAPGEERPRATLNVDGPALSQIAWSNKGRFLAGAFSAPVFLPKEAAIARVWDVKPGIYRDLLIPLQDVPDRSQLLSTQIAWEMKRANYLVILVPSSHFLYFWHSIDFRSRDIALPTATVDLSRILPAGTPRPELLQWSYNGDMLAVSAGTNVFLFDARGDWSAPCAAHTFDAPIRALCWSPECDRLYVTLAPASLVALQVQCPGSAEAGSGMPKPTFHGTPLRTIADHSSLGLLDYDFCTNTLVTGGASSVLTFWCAQTLMPIETLCPVDEPIVAAKFCRISRLRSCLIIQTLSGRVIFLKRMPNGLLQPDRVYTASTVIDPPGQSVTLPSVPVCSFSARARHDETNFSSLVNVSYLLPGESTAVADIVIPPDTL